MILCRGIRKEYDGRIQRKGTCREKRADEKIDRLTTFIISGTFSKKISEMVTTSEDSHGNVL